MNLRSVLGLAWVEGREGGYVGGGRKDLGPPAPHVQSSEAGNCVGQQASAGSGRCGSWWGLLGTDAAASLAQIWNSPAAFALTGLVQRGREVGHKFS